jgi:hypothetical protein
MPVNSGGVDSFTPGPVYLVARESIYSLKSLMYMMLFICVSIAVVKLIEGPSVLCLVVMCQMRSHSQASAWDLLVIYKQVLTVKKKKENNEGM